MIFCIGNKFKPVADNWKTVTLFSLEVNKARDSWALAVCVWIQISLDLKVIGTGFNKEMAITCATLAIVSGSHPVDVMHELVGVDFLSHLHLFTAAVVREDVKFLNNIGVIVGDGWSWDQFLIGVLVFVSLSHGSEKQLDFTLFSCTSRVICCESACATRGQGDDISASRKYIIIVRCLALRAWLEQLNEHLITACTVSENLWRLRLSRQIQCRAFSF